MCHSKWGFSFGGDAIRELKPDTKLPVYLMYPRFLLELDMNDTAKMVYLLLYDRARLSMQNGWLDENGRVFVYYTEEHLAEALRRTEATIRTAMNTLEHHGLILRKRQGAGRPNRIYVRIPKAAQTYDRKFDTYQTERKLAYSKNESKNEYFTG